MLVPYQLRRRHERRQRQCNEQDSRSGDETVPRTLEHLAREGAARGGFWDKVTHLRVLGSDTGGCAVGATEGDGAVDGSAGHVVELAGGVDDLVDGLHREVPGHCGWLVAGDVMMTLADGHVR